MRRISNRRSAGLQRKWAAPAGSWRGRPLFAGTEVAPKRLTVRLSAQRGRDLIPGPVRGTGLPHGQLDGLLSDPSGVGGGLDQLLDRCCHPTNHGMIYGTTQGGILAAWSPNRVSPRAGEGNPRYQRGDGPPPVLPSWLGTAKPVVSCELGSSTDNGEYHA